MPGTSLNEILSSLDDAFAAKPTASSAKTTTKTAAEAGSSGSVGRAKDSLVTALKEAEQALRQPPKTVTKVKEAATKPNPTQMLREKAAQLAAAESEANLKHASLMGTAFCDGFVARLAQFERAGQDVLATQKTAEVNGTGLEKFAEANPDLFLKIAQMGYQQAMAEVSESLVQQELEQINPKELQKFASEDPQGFKRAVEQGYKETWAELEKMAKAHDTALDTTLSEVEKVARDNFDRGYQSGNNLVAYYKQAQAKQARTVARR